MIYPSKNDRWIPNNEDLSIGPLHICWTRTMWQKDDTVEMQCAGKLTFFPLCWMGKRNLHSYFSGNTSVATMPWIFWTGLFVNMRILVWNGCRATLVNGYVGQNSQDIELSTIFSHMSTILSPYDHHMFTIFFCLNSNLLQSCCRRPSIRWSCKCGSLDDWQRRLGRFFFFTKCLEWGNDP